MNNENKPTNKMNENDIIKKYVESILTDLVLSETIKIWQPACEPWLWSLPGNFQVKMEMTEHRKSCP